MNFIYLVTERSSHDDGFKTWAVIKAFKSKEKALEFSDWLIKYNSDNKITGIKRDVFIKEVELSE